MGTKAEGERLKEAGNINMSLLTLGRCIEMMRYNQSKNTTLKIVPFRESKLTRIFQSYLVGRSELGYEGKLTMIVNISQVVIVCSTHYYANTNYIKSNLILLKLHLQVFSLI